MKKKTKTIVTYAVLFLLVLFSLILIWQLGFIKFEIPPTWLPGEYFEWQEDGNWYCQVACTSSKGYFTCYSYSNSAPDGMPLISAEVLDGNGQASGTYDYGSGVYTVVGSGPIGQGLRVIAKFGYISTTTITTTTTVPPIYPDGEGMFILIAILILSVALVGSLFYFKTIKL